MRAILRSVGAVVAGFVAASIVMMIVEYINGRVLYPEMGKAAAGITDREQLRALMAAAPVGAFLVVLVGWALGGLAGGWVAARLAEREPAQHALRLGVLLTLFGIMNNLMLPPPMWFWVVSMLVLVPAALMGGRLASKR